MENQYVYDCFCHYSGVIVILSALFTEEHQLRSYIYKEFVLSKTQHIICLAGKTSLSLKMFV